VIAAIATHPQVWARTTHVSGAKCYFVGSHALLHRDFLVQQPKRIGDEVYFAHEPARLVFDVDGKGMLPEDMKALVETINAKCVEALRKRYGLEGVRLIELDGSRAAKQSRHLYFDGAIFASLADMRRFVQADILPLHDAVDEAIYSGTSRCLRLPLAAKFDGDSVFRPIWRETPFEFSRSVRLLRERADPSDGQRAARSPPAAPADDGGAGAAAAGGAGWLRRGSPDTPDGRGAAHPRQARPLAARRPREHPSQVRVPPQRRLVPHEEGHPREQPHGLQLLVRCRLGGAPVHRALPLQVPRPPVPQHAVGPRRPDGPFRLSG